MAKKYKIRLGKLEKDMHNFLKRYPHEWISYSKDYTTKKVANSLKRKGLICTNKFSQFKLKRGKC